MRALRRAADLEIALAMTQAFAPIPLSPLSRGVQPLNRAAVLGAGAWGTALASALQHGGVQTRLWARQSDVVQAILSQRRNPHYLPGIELPAGLGASTDLAEVLAGAQLVILAVPSSATRGVARQAAPLLAPGTVVLSASKGIEQETGALMTRVLDETLGPEILTGALGGPGLAIEVARARSTLLLLALPALERFHPRSREARRIADSLARQLALAGVTLESTRDVVGTQVGGTLKNVAAIACGMATALGLGENARAGIITRALEDMRRLTQAMGGRLETLLGCSGAGDLFLTVASEHSRHTRLGERLGKACAEARRVPGELAEGALSALGLEILERRYGLHLDVAAAVRDVLQQRATPGAALHRLLHDTLPDAKTPVSRIPRPATAQPEALGYA